MRLIVLSWVSDVVLVGRIGVVVLVDEICVGQICVCGGVVCR